MGKWSTPTKKCEVCGLEYQGGQRLLHERSVFHLNHKEIRTLLSDPMVNFTMVANKYEISRERIRQIQRDILGGAPGRRRETFRSLLNRQLRWKEVLNSVRNDPYVKAVEKICQQKGLSFEFLAPRYNKNYTFPNVRLRVKINGHVCRLRKAYRYNPFKRVGRGHSYVRITGTAHHAEFTIFNYEGIFFIFPKKRIGHMKPGMSTQFSLNPIGNFGTHNTTHDYLDYREAWHLLK